MRSCQWGNAQRPISKLTFGWEINDLKIVTKAISTKLKCANEKLKTRDVSGVNGKAKKYLPNWEADPQGGRSRRADTSTNISLREKTPRERGEEQTQKLPEIQEALPYPGYHHFHGRRFNTLLSAIALSIQSHSKDAGMETWSFSPTQHTLVTGVTVKWGIRLEYRSPPSLSLLPFCPQLPSCHPFICPLSFLPHPHLLFPSSHFYSFLPFSSPLSFLPTLPFLPSIDFVHLYLLPIVLNTLPFTLIYRSCSFTSTLLDTVYQKTLS